MNVLTCGVTGSTTAEIIAAINANSAKPNRNNIINGGFDIWQRGENINISAIEYMADRWVTGYNPDATIVKSTVLIDDKEVNSLKFTTNGTGNIIITQRIEKPIHLLNQSVILSYYIRANRNLNNQNGIENDFGSRPITTEWVKQTITKTLGSSFTNADFMTLDVSRVLSPSANDWIEVAQVQLEEGSITTPFEQRPIGLELSLCQRYYQRLKASRPLLGTATSTTVVYATILFLTTMRALPALAHSGYSSDLTLSDGVSTHEVTVMEILSWAADKRGGAVKFTSGSTITQFRPYFFSITNDAYIDFDAEL